MTHLVAFLLIACSQVWATDLAQYAGKDHMNGIKFDDHKSFAENWTLVTIRFRKDTGEMRLTYANPKAFEALRAGKVNYPDGAVFAKTGVLTGVDAQFPSSVVPRAIRRYQLMVKDAKSYAATGGWAYALFDAEGKTYPEEPAQAQRACHACHVMVENRGYVFSEPFNFTMGAKFARARLADGPKLAFKTVRAKVLPANVRALLLKTETSVRFLDSKVLRSNVFQGTLDEVKPILEMEALTVKKPAVFLSADDKKFTLVRPLKRPECLNELGAELVSTGLDGSPVKLEICLHD